MLRPAAGLALALIVALPLSAQEPDWTEVRARRQADGVRGIDVQVGYLAGDLRIGTASEGLLYDAHLRYDASRLRPRRQWSVRDGLGRLAIEFDDPDGEGPGSLDLDMDADKGDAGFLDLGLSAGLPTDLEIKVGAARSELHLGGLSLTNLVLVTGASETELTFESPNPRRMQRLELTVGAAKLEARGLGNAAFDEMSFKGGVGDVRLDFSGEWRADGRAAMGMGFGSLEIAVPAELGVRIHKKGFLAALDAPGFDRVGEGYQSPNWASAAHHLEIDLEAAFGSITVHRAR